MGLILLTAIVMVVIFAGFMLLRRPVYRISQENVERLLEMMLARKASLNDWHVFLAVPIHYDEYLENIRHLCLEIEESESCVINTRILTNKGEEALREILAELKQHGIKDF
ncbi:hypothetical protein [Gynuella sunshinyii]|uniref:Uncharacterized protein n=1 Tax=Gynuella sunshinyii YC6258 TaxID=1445510 RepID=A0A0C5VPW4_9GAMM|nr:hypothetical protein [Gynuella sunshinyii]AJQ96241.1 hypothetical Protein YC6258_04207 [Gynuella sunshinyii YC6258]